MADFIIKHKGKQGGEKDEDAQVLEVPQMLRSAAQGGGQLRHLPGLLGRGNAETHCQEEQGLDEEWAQRQGSMSDEW